MGVKNETKWRPRCRIGKGTLCGNLNHCVTRYIGTDGKVHFIVCPRFVP